MDGVTRSEAVHLAPVSDTQVVIGGGEVANTASQIRICTWNSGRCKTRESYEHSPLSPTQWRPFWVRWSSSSVQLGVGSTVGERLYLQSTFQRDMAVNVLMIAGRDVPFAVSFGKSVLKPTDLTD